MRALRAVSIVVTIFLLAACATSQPTMITGEALDALGKQFLDTGMLYDRLHAAKRVSDADYKRWVDFTYKFKVTYRAAVTAWQSGQGQVATDAALTLKNQLRDFVLFALERSN